jgi:hypothetical protein
MAIRVVSWVHLQLESASRSLVVGFPAKCLMVSFGWSTRTTVSRLASRRLGSRRSASVCQCPVKWHPWADLRNNGTLYASWRLASRRSASVCQYRVVLRAKASLGSIWNWIGVATLGVVSPASFPMTSPVWSSPRMVSWLASRRSESVCQRRVVWHPLPHLCYIWNFVSGS